MMNTKKHPIARLPLFQTLLLAAVTLVAVGAQGCHDVDRGAETPVDVTDTTDAYEPDAVADTGSPAPDATGPTPDTKQPPVDPTDPVDPVDPVDTLASTVCLPQAHSQADPMAADLFTWVVEGVEAVEAGQMPRLVAVEAEVTRDPFDGQLELAAGDWPQPGTVTCDAAGLCLETLPALTRVWRQPLDRPWWPGAETGEDWAGILLPQRDTATGAIHVTLRAARVSYGAIVELGRVYDASGQLLVEDYRFDGNLWWHTEQSWRDGRLVSARHEDHVNGTGTTTLVWNHDAAGRLTRLTVRGQDGHSEARWRYDEAGRPQRMDRLRDGEVVLQHSWIWRETAEARPVIAEHRVERAPGFYDRTTADTWQLDMMIGMFPEHLSPRESIDPATGEACQMPPLTIGHGYPGWEQVYDLGWPVGERPDDIEHAYGPMRYYMSLRDAPYTHSGPELYGWGWESYADTNAHVEVTTRYDEAGRMIAEDAEATYEDGTVTSSHRERQLGPHGVELDTMTGLRDHHSQLRMIRDETGRLVRREHRLDDKLVAAQDWVFDEAGRIAEHDTAYASTVVGYYYPWQDDEAFEEMLSQIGELDAGARIVLRWSDDGRVRERLHSDTLEVTERLVYDAAGRIIERVQPGQWQQVQAWDDHTGARILHQSDWQIDGTIDDFYQVTLGAAGQIEHRTWSHPGLELVETFLYE